MFIAIKPTDNRVVIRLDPDIAPSDVLWVADDAMKTADTGTVVARGPAARYLRKGDRVKWNPQARGQTRVSNGYTEWVMIREIERDEAGGLTIVGTIQTEEELMGEVIAPLGARVLIKQDEAEERTRGGLYVPETVREKARPARGEVRSIGPEVQSIAVGDRVLFSMWVGSPVMVDGEELLLMLEDDVQAIIQEVQ
jgi:chaperonin GroES